MFLRVRKLPASLLLSVIILAGIGCSREDNSSGKSFQSFRDIPGITDEEIAGIEALKSQRKSFSYGMLLSHDAFVLSGGDELSQWRHAGFSSHFCDLLSHLFGIPFIPETHDWQELKNRLDSHAIDFTATMNATTDLENQYIKSSPVIGNRLSVFIKEGAIDIISEYDLRGLKIGFFADSSSEQIFRNNFPRVNFQSVAISTLQEMAEKLNTGEIDAFIVDAPDVFTFYEFDHVAKVRTFPYVYVPVSVSTANPELEPVISVITKFLMAGGIDEVTRLNEIGEQDYASHVFNLALNEEERVYIASLKTNGEKVPVGFTNARYPVAFYDKESGEYQGIAKDVLDEISKLTGIEFKAAHDTSTGWVQLENMLRTGEIKLLSQLIPNEARREYAIWPDTHYFTSRYALLSNLSFPYLSLNQVPYVRVGLPAGTAEEAIYRLWFPDAEYITYRTTDEGLTALETGEIDLYFCLDYTLLYESNYRENAGQKVNIMFNDPVEVVPFGLNKNEVILCSIISKAQRIINTDRIVRSWTSRVFDQSSQMAMERVRYLTITVICLLILLIVMFISILISSRLRKSAAESRGNLHILLDMLPIGVRILSLDDWTLLYSNKACLSVFGCTSFKEQVEGRSGLGFMPEVQPDGRPTAEHLNEIFKTDRACAEIQCLKLNGEPFTCRMTSCTIKYPDQNGHKHRASLGVMEDTTAEEEYRQMLKNTALKEQEANQLKTRFLTMMSHEIRTPMNAILGITEIQLNNETLPEATEEAFVKIYDSGILLLNIINDILDFSKIEAGKLEIVPVQYNVPNLLNDTVQLNRLRYESKPIEFSLKIEEGTPMYLFGDEFRIKQIFNNLLSNSFKYTSEGRIEMSVCAEKEKDNETAAMIFRISDTGQGMNEDQVNRLFEEYSRFNMDINHGISGTGLGMSITKRLIDMMGGEIVVESEFGKGTRFTVRLPQKITGSAVCTAEIAEKLQNFNYRRAPISKRTQLAYEHMPYGSVLIVDDIASNLYVSIGLLTPYGLQIETAESGMEAIDKIKKGNVYDIIFMDHMMPVMNGIQATKILRSMGYTGYIVALTANAVVGQDKMFFENGFNGFISKPIDSHELNVLLNDLIRNKKSPEVKEAAPMELNSREREKTASAKKISELTEIQKLFVLDAENTVNMLKDVMANPISGEFDFELFTTIVHGIKSALANIDEKELSSFALMLEKAGEERNYAVISEQTPVLINALTSLIEKFSRE